MIKMNKQNWGWGGMGLEQSFSWATSKDLTRVQTPPGPGGRQVSQDGTCEPTDWASRAASNAQRGDYTPDLPSYPLNNIPQGSLKKKKNLVCISQQMTLKFAPLT